MTSLIAGMLHNSDTKSSAAKQAGPLGIEFLSCVYTAGHNSNVIMYSFNGPCCGDGNTLTANIARLRYALSRDSERGPLSTPNPISDQRTMVTKTRYIIVALKIGLITTFEVRNPSAPREPKTTSSVGSRSRLSPPQCPRPGPGGQFVPHAARQSLRAPHAGRAIERASVVNGYRGHDTAPPTGSSFPGRSAVCSASSNENRGAAPASSP
jgi:hypothetical protein